MSDTTIARVAARAVWDSRGRPTVEADVELAGGARGRAIAPAGASRGSGEASDLRDGGARLGGFGVERAISNVRGEIARRLAGMDASDQTAVDTALVELDGGERMERLGGNATIAVSLATLHACARATELPLWSSLARARPVRLPLPQIQIFGGGAHAARRTDVQDFMVVPVAARSFGEALEVAAEVHAAAGRLLAADGRLRGVADEGGWWPEFAGNQEALEWLVRAIEAAGYTPGDDVAIALDVAASELGSGGRYTLGLERRELDSDALCEHIVSWVDRHPIVSVEDPLGEDDADGMRRFMASVGDRVQVVGDDFLVTDAERVRRAAREATCNAVLVKPNQAGTVTGALRALEAARASGLATIVSARSGETEDTSIVHLAVGWNAGQLKVGSFQRSERMAKWNEGLRIEEALGARARFAGRGALREGGTT